VDAASPCDVEQIGGRCDQHTMSDHAVAKRDEMAKLTDERAPCCPGQLLAPAPARTIRLGCIVRKLAESLVAHAQLERDYSH
jgi:hypothetical protein